VTPIKKDDAEKLLEKTMEIARNVIDDLEKKMELATFPKL